MRRKSAIIRLKPNRARILEAILFVVSEADRLRKATTQYDIVKSVFLADRRHLNEYGRPITFDHYVAMKHGPVPSVVYDLLKKNPQHANLPWQKRPMENGKSEFFGAARDVDEDVLSESDFEALSEAFVIVKSLGFAQIRRLTHEDPAYLDAWEEDSTAKRFDMSYAMLFDVPDPEKAQELAFISEHM